MTPSQQAKSHGLKSLTQVAEMVGRKPRLLHDWAKKFPDLFEIVLLGCKAKLSI